MADTLNHSIVRVISPSIDRQGNQIVIRGVLDNNFLGHISTPDYQRELIKNRVFWGLVNTFTKQAESFLKEETHESPSVPDITLAYRQCKEYKSGKDGSVFLGGSKLYLVDGLQRVSALLHARELFHEQSTNPFKASLGCKIYLDTSVEMEREMFKTLNTNHTSVAADVILREYRHTSVSAAAIYDWASLETATKLSRHICWQQNMKKEHMLRASSVFRTMNTLHARFDGHGGVTKTADLIKTADLQVQAIGGYDAYLRNLDYFYDALDQAFRLTNPQERVPNSMHLLPHLAFADVLAKHDDFWEPGAPTLKIQPSVIAKISTFSFSKEEVRMMMASTKSSIVTLLRTLMVEHLNKGKQYKLSLTQGKTRAKQANV